MANEQTILKKFLLEFSRLGSRFFRCNTGQAWSGGPIWRAKRTGPHQLQKGSIVIENPRPFKTGWPKGTSDLIGFSSITIQQDMVGKTVAVFTAIEVKSSKRIKVTKEQHAFVRMVNDKGGIATIAYDLDDYLKALQNFNKEGKNDDRH